MCDKGVHVKWTCAMNIWAWQKQNAHDECMNSSNPHTTHSDNQSDEHAGNKNMHDNETT